MEAQQFADWRHAMKLNRTQAAKALGIGRNMPQKFEEGDAIIPLSIALACAALIRGIKPWPQ